MMANLGIIVMKMNINTFTVHGFAEQRLLHKTPDNDATNDPDAADIALLQRLKGEEGMTNRERIEAKFRAQPTTTIGKIKGIEQKWWKAGMLDERSTNKLITDEAKRRVMATGTSILKHGQDAEQKLFKVSAAANDSKAVLEMRRTVCGEVIKHLEDEIKAKEGLRTRYFDAAKRIGQLKKDAKEESLDVPELKNTRYQKTLVEKFDKDTEAKLAEHAKDPVRADVEKTFDDLLALTQEASPELSANIERLILNNATGVDGKSLLIKEINGFKNISKTERQTLVTLAKHLQLGYFNTQRNRAVREYFQARVLDSTKNNPPTLKERLSRLKEANIGQSVALYDGNAWVNFSVLRKEDGKGGQIALVSEKGRRHAVINIGSGKVTLSEGRGTASAELDVYNVGPDLDPTKMYFVGKNKKTSLSQAV